MYERSRAGCFPGWEESAGLEENGSSIKDGAAFGKWQKRPRVAEARGKEVKGRTMEGRTGFSEMESVMSFSLRQ